jgi:hypothetical protein
MCGRDVQVAVCWSSVQTIFFFGGRFFCEEKTQLFSDFFVMYKVVKATLLLKKTLRKRAADREYSKNTVYLQNVQTYKIFSPKTLHALLLNERYGLTSPFHLTHAL